MSGTNIPPSALADLYDSLYTMLETLPSETHPAWELAIESVLFGGEGIAPEVTPYGEQQAEQNDFKISAYRTQYGDGEKVTEFPTLTTQSACESDRQYIDEEIQLPVSPESETVLPLFVDDESLPEAVRLLNAFPTKPGSETSDTSSSNLLNPRRFPGLTTSVAEQTATADEEDTGPPSPEHAAIPPNELADLYDGLYTILKSLPNNTDPRWEEAIESVLFGGKYLHAAAIPYAEQQAERNEFGMPDYRSQYGDGTRVTAFPAVTTTQPAGDDAQYVESGGKLPVVPNTQATLPFAPTGEALADAAHLLAEFPRNPNADTGERDHRSSFDTDAFFADIDSNAQPDETESSAKGQATSGSSVENDRASSHADTENRTETNPSASTTETDVETAGEGLDSPSADETVLRQESAGKCTMPQDQAVDSSSEPSQKYDDPQAERAHRRAQQRDPSDVVELGEEIKLTLKQVDYSSRPPTIMGTKNRLVVFVIDAPQDLSEYETIKATIVDYGGKNNSAEAAFSGYTD